MAKDKELQRLGNRFAGIYRRKEWKQQWTFFLLVQRWEKLVGREMAAHSSPAFIRNQEVWVYVDSSAMMQHMQLQKTDLLARVQESFPELQVNDLRWLSCPANVPSPPCEVSTRPKPPDTAESREAYGRFQQLTRSIADLQCREALNNLYRCFQQNTAKNE